MKIYKAKTLFQGYNIGLQNAKMYIGVPGRQNYPSDQNYENERNFEVQYEDKFMRIRSWKKAEIYFPFKDLKGRGDYFLGYFEWKPIIEPEQVSTMSALSKMVGTKKWEDLRKTLHE